jgi:hypothetical protein
MARSKEKIEQRNADLVRKYQRYSKLHDQGRQKHNHSWIIFQLSKEFFISETTVEKIIKRTA